MIKSTHSLFSRFSRSHGLRGNAYLNAPAFRDAEVSIIAFPRRSVGTRDTHSLGFTLIELLITLGIVAIIMGIAVPSFQSIIATNRLTTQANSMVGALTVARSEAAKRNKVVFVGQNGGGWASGWHVFIDKNNNKKFDDGIDDNIRQYPAITGNTIKTTNNVNNSISYKPSGTSIGASIYFCSSAKLAAFRRVVISNSGRVRTETESTSSETYAVRCK